MPNLLDILNTNGITYDNGGCWRVFGGRNSTFGAYSSPVDLEVGGVVSTYSILDILPGGDNPNITDWICDYRYIGLLYGCTSSVPGCLCPTGVDCPNSELYVFDTDGCCCTLPCAGDFVECTYSTDFGYTLTAFTSSTIQLTSLILDGVQYVTSPVTMPAPNIINIGGQNYNTAFADLINSVGAPNFFAVYPNLTQILSAQLQGSSIPSRNNIIRFKYPDCLTFEVTVVTADETLVWNNTSYNGLNGTFFYGFPGPIDCTNTNEC